MSERVLQGSFLGEVRRPLRKCLHVLANYRFLVRGIFQRVEEFAKDLLLGATSEWNITHAAPPHCQRVFSRRPESEAGHANSAAGPCPRLCPVRGRFLPSRADRKTAC